MPGVLQLEAMAQCAIPSILTLEQFKGRLAMFGAMDNIRFKNIVRPGDRFDMEVELTKLKGPVGKSRGVGYVDGKVVVEAEFTVFIK